MTVQGTSSPLTSILKGRSMLAISIGIYLVAIAILGVWAKGKVHTAEDFIVAGRRLPLSLSTFTLLATWFGAGTVLTASDEIKVEGLSVVALEPYGAGAALILAGLFFARPLWNMKLLTIPDFYRRVYGPRAEKLMVFVSIPSFIGWIGIQLVAVAGILNVFFELPLWIGILLTAGVATAYTVAGGMWSVTVTDAVQLSLVMIGLVILLFEVFQALGNGSLAQGMGNTFAHRSPEFMILVPRENLKEFVGWVGLFFVSALGNIPGQDLGQRIFAANSANTARLACLWSGGLYMVFGTIPVLLAVAGAEALPAEVKQSVLPLMAKMYLSEGLNVVFTLALLSAVFSTIDSAILAPASTLANNVLREMFPKRPLLQLLHGCVLLIAAVSVAVAFMGNDMFAVLEWAYSAIFVAFFASFAAGVFVKNVIEGQALASMIGGIGAWGLGLAFWSDWPTALIAAAFSGAAFFLYPWFQARLSRT